MLLDDDTGRIRRVGHTVDGLKRRVRSVNAAMDDADGRADAAAECAAAMDAQCAALEAAVGRALEPLDARLRTQEAAVRAAQRSLSQAIHKLRTGRAAADEQLRTVRRQRQREQQEAREDKQWLAGVWPEGVPLPTMLQPFAAVHSADDGARVADVADDHKRRRMEAMVNRRVQRERVVQRMEAAAMWTVVVPPVDGVDGVDAQPYYIHTTTGETSWDAPAAMFYEPPEGWDAERMDWHPSWPLERFYPPADEPSTDREGEDEDIDDPDDTMDDEAVDEDANDAAADPVQLRREMERALTAHEQLTTQLVDSKAKQRTLALQLLNASREAFENEKEAIAVEDKKVKDAERARRKVEAQEQAAARAKEAAAERRRLEAENPGQQFAKYARDSVTNKGLTLAKDDNALEKELEAFAAEQRADRAYLTSPVAVDGRARVHKRADDEYAHMKMLESEVQKQEQLEFDLLEKTSLRVEETTTKSEELQALAEEIRTQRVVIAEELAAVAHTITRLELPLEHPSIERPTSEELRRAEERFITVESQDEQDLDEDDNNETPKDDERETDSLPKVDPAAMSADERELVQLKSFVKVETQWRLWEKEEAMRVEELLAAQTRSQSLMTSDRSLAVDLAMCEADEIFFGKLKELEKAGNTRMWTNQADAQVERARFMIERAAREESEYQLQDRVAELQVLLEEARRLPLRALNAVHRLELERESDQHVAELTEKLGDANRQLDKEKQARKLLQKLELRSTEYFGRKLDEEAALFQDKQALWDLSARLVDEIQADRLTIARLYELMDSTDSTDEIKEQPQLTVVNDASSAFEAKLQLLQHVREFLLASYERDARWRELAAMALIPDSTSAEWMTAAQNARHGKMLATLAEQHAEREAELQRELKLRARIEEQLHSELVRASSKADRQREEYEDAFACVHTQTQAALAELQQEICALKAELTDERSRFNEDKQRLITHHDQVRLELETRNSALERVNEDQRHWLTAAKRELTAQRVANDELVKSAQALEKRRASEVNDLRFRVAAQVKKINTIEMWNLAMKIKSKEANAERVRMLREFAVKTEQHRELQRLLRLANWRHRVAAQAILSNVDWLFAFFADGLEVLAGATESSNDALRRNAGVQVLSVLAAHSSQPRVQQICARALGRLAWNENVTPRALGWAAATLWSRWVRERSDEVLADLSSRGLEFDAEAREDATSFNWLDDPPKVADAEVIARKKLRFIRSWLRVEDFARPSENAANQEFIGLTPGVLQVLVDLCGPSVDDLKLRRHALESLALVAMNTRNTAVVGRMDGVIPLLSCLIRPPSILDDSSSSSGHLEDWEVVRCAVRAIGNLAFENRFNQQGFVQEDVVRQLLSYCSLTDNNDSLDVDLVLASVQALTNIIHEYVAAGERLVASGGISILARLCNSPLVHDAVELEVAEAIHAHAALVLSTAVTLLDEEACEGDERATYAAGLVMKEGVDPFVLMCASCNRDVALHGALVLGTIARRDDVRAAIGSAGGVDALFLLIDSRPQDTETTAVAAWAIANLTWHRENQYRVARYMSTLLRLCSTPSLSSAEGENPCERVHALCAFANTLFYNEASRQLVARDTRWLVLLERICVDEDPGEALQHAARALCALSYSDELALAMGVDDNNHAEKLFPFNGLALFLRLAGRPNVGVEVQRLALFGIVNLVLHDVNKPRVLRVPLAIETLVNLSAHDAPEVREPATEALELLADVRSVPPEVMESPVTGQTSEQLRRLVALLEDDKSSSAAVSMAADAIADEAWKRPNAKARLRNARAIEALLTRSRADTSSPAAVVSCLWAVRNVVADNPRNQDVAGALDAVTTLVGLLDQRRHRFVDERGADRGEDVAEATLAALVAVVLRHPRNSQELVRLGLDVLLAIAEEKRDVEREETQQPRKTEIAALATELLEIVAPHNAPVLPVIDRKAGASPDKAKLRARHGPTALPTLAPR